MELRKLNKYIIGSVAILLGALSISSCENLVDESPISEISPDNFFRNNNDALATVIGMYDGMQPAFRLKHYYWGEFRGDSYINGNDGANANNIELTTNDVTSGNAGVLRWNDYYDLINRANLVIANVPNISGFDAELLAEAQAMRAYAYFQAVRVWGDVPLFTEPVIGASPDLQRPRTEANTIINEVIIPDMLAAEENMDIVSRPYRFSLTSIWALQAEVYGFLGDDIKTKEALLKIVESNEFSLVTSARDWQNLFLNDNIDPFAPNPSSSGPLKIQQGPELIMSIGFSLNEEPGSGNRNRAGIFNLFFAGIPSFTLSPALEQKWREKFPIDSLEWVTKYPDTDPVLTTTNEEGEEEFVYGDYRYYLSREGITNLELKGVGNARMAKYNKANFNQTLDDSDMVLYRYSNIVLYLAEVENRLGNELRALEIINEFRTARQLPLVEAAEFGATEQERELFILDERQLELLGEGQRWWDLRRTGRALEILNPILDTLTGGRTLTDERLLFPIFDEHLVENPLLEQTPGY
ncbi:RagB/SusD family nutrient uptake outer membrane protein [Maribacter sp. M208]|uniref:RagB/SusD family nutrient uptake outer membrane protein n=1 Tax=Maribacter huludaoensis TaxID=3030010 RepID=UPI0023EDA3F5|nr:RagB/SusD family nutrient uptake outer membrane protein [Maribacter huludaoensis]MDF4221591.1 RagB/SusD family nutrient uptake outer membrane protein [Maribacter huludaoensis]